MVEGIKKGGRRGKEGGKKEEDQKRMNCYYVYLVASHPVHGPRN